jgi:transposase
MYFYRKKSPTGQVLQLLESYRNADGKPRTRVVASLGDADFPEEIKPDIAREVAAQLYGRPEVLPCCDEVARAADRIVKLVIRRGRWQRSATSDQKTTGNGQLDGVIVNEVTHTHNTTLGAELVGLHAWDDLQLTTLLESLGFNASQRQAACIQVIGRLVHPSSELGLADRFLDGSSLPDLLGVKAETLSSIHRYYRVSDKLLANRDTIQAHCRNVLQQRLSLSRTYYLYDLTNTHFEGLCKANPKAKRGKSKQKRNDCPLVAAGVCFDEHGFVLFHKTFAGNTHDSVTLPEMVREMHACSQADDLLAGAQQPIVVIDGGLATQDNLAILRKEGFRYLVNRTRSTRTGFAEQFADIDQFVRVPGRKSENDVLVRKIDALDGDPPDALILCRSAQRSKKEHAMRSGAEERFLTDVQKLCARIQAGRLKAPEKIQRAIGRINAKHTRVARFYTITLTQGGKLTWERNDQSFEQAHDLDGCYVLQTNVEQMGAVDLWRNYIMLTKAEAGFRSLKSDLGLRPNFHQLEHRVDGHIFITVLAYQLMRYITYRLEQAGDTRTWPILRQLLQTHCYATIIMPTASGTTWRIRRPGLPEAIQRRIYRNLDICLKELPQTTTVHSKN